MAIAILSSVLLIKVRYSPSSLVHDMIPHSATKENGLIKKEKRRINIAGIIINRTELKGRCSTTT